MKMSFLKTNSRKFGSIPAPLRGKSDHAAATFFQGGGIKWQRLNRSKLMNYPSFRELLVAEFFGLDVEVQLLAHIFSFAFSCNNKYLYNYMLRPKQYIWCAFLCEIYIYLQA